MTDPFAQPGMQTGGDWAYVGPNGPANWPQSCRSSQGQSPINLQSNTAKLAKSKRFQFSWKSEKRATAKHNGKFIEIQPGAGNQLNMDGETYVLSRIDIHAPSEHWINGMYGDAEVQMISKGVVSRKTIIHSVVYSIDPKASSSSFLDGLEKLPKKAGKQSTVTVDLPNLLKKVDDFVKRWEYTGSMTVPPCEGNVQWFIASEFVNSKLRTLDPVTNAVGFSARPIQRFN